MSICLLIVIINTYHKSHNEMHIYRSSRIIYFNINNLWSDIKTAGVLQYVMDWANWRKQNLLFKWTISFRLGDNKFNRKPASHTVSVEFDRCEHLPGTECLIKDAIKLHYGKWKI